VSRGVAVPTGPTTPVAELRALAKDRMASGQLPHAGGSEKLFAGYGNDLDFCAVCGGKITRQNVQYEVVLPNRTEPLFFHIACHSALHVESASPPKQQKKLIAK